MKLNSLKKRNLLLSAIVLFFLVFSSKSAQSQDRIWSSAHIQKAEQYGTTKSDNRGLELIFVTADEASGLSKIAAIYKSEKEALEAFLTSAVRKDVHTVYVLADRSTSRFMDVWQVIDRIIAIENQNK
jgi:hypothetical protein